MRYVAALVCASLLWFAVSIDAADLAPLPRLEVYATATGTRPWRVRLVGADGAALFVHSSAYATEGAAVARAEEIRAAMGSTVEIRYPSWVAPAPPPAADPLAIRALHEATPEGRPVAELIALWGPPRSVARWDGAGWVRIPAETPWVDGESRITTWGEPEPGVLWCVQMDSSGRVLTRSVAWDALPTGAVPWTR